MSGELDRLAIVLSVFEHCAALDDDEMRSLAVMRALYFAADLAGEHRDPRMRAAGEEPA